MGSSKDDSATDGDNSGGDLPDSNSSLFSEGEKVLAYHGPRIYEAKVLIFSLPFPFPFFSIFVCFVISHEHSSVLVDWEKLCSYILYQFEVLNF